MKSRILLGTCLLLCLILLAACGRNGSQTTTGSSPIQAQAAPSPQVPTGDTPVYITYQNGKMSSSMTTFEKGAPYFLIIVNKDSAEHQFEITPVVMGGHVLHAPTPLATVANVQPGTTRTLSFVFKTVAARRQLAFMDAVGYACVPGKYVGIIVVNK